MNRKIMIKPLADRIVLIIIEESSVTAGGILLPDSSKEKPTKGRVVAVGVDVKEVYTEDVVLFTKWGGTEVTHNGKDYLIIKEQDIIGIENNVES